MKFQSKYPNPVFTVQSEVNLGDVRGRTPQRGLSADFRGNEFDTEVAQHQFGWTDNERLFVENWLTNSDEYGVGKTFWLLGAEAPVDVGAVLASIRPDYCSRTKITAAGPEPCGNPTAEGAVFCMSCLLEMNADRAEQAQAQELIRTARERSPEEVGVPLTGGRKGMPEKDPSTGQFLPKRETDPVGV